MKERKGEGEVVNEREKEGDEVRLVKWLQPASPLIIIFLNKGRNWEFYPSINMEKSPNCPILLTGFHNMHVNYVNVCKKSLASIINRQMHDCLCVDMRRGINYER